MSRLQELATRVRELEELIARCMRCGLCQATCPVYSTTARESDVARGKLALLDGLMEKVLADASDASASIRRCLLCGTCASQCPSGVRVVEIFIRARAILAEVRGLSVTKRVVLRGLLARPALFDRLLTWGTRLQWLACRPVADAPGVVCSRAFVPGLGGRRGPPLAAVAFHRSLPSPECLAGPGPTVALFVGCAIDRLFPQVGHAALAALRHHGFGVRIPEEQACCGIPALAAGDVDTFRRLLRHNLKVFGREPFSYLVTPCATCTSTLKHMWPLMQGPLSSEEAVGLSTLVQRTVDIHQFLASHTTVEPRTSERDALPLTYHDPCHLRRSLGVVEAPRSLIRANRAYTLREMSNAGDCCGCGGSFNLEHYDISVAIGERKLAGIEQTGSRVVATGCPACMMHLTDMVSRAGAAVQVKHALEVYAEALPAI